MLDTIDAFAPEPRPVDHEVTVAALIEPLFRLESYFWTMWPVLMWYAGNLF